MESYAYAAAAEGYYNLSTTFAIMQPGVALPDIANYHPNHPLGHMITRALHQWTLVGAFTIFRVTNFIAALLVLFLFYQCAFFLLRRVFPAIAASTLFIFTYVVWGSALSGEVQLPALSLQLAATYFLLLYLARPAESIAPDKIPVADPRHLWYAGFFFVWAMAFHLSTILWIIPAAVSTLLHSAKKTQWKLYAKLTAFISIGFIFFYVILVVAMLKIDSTELYWRTAQMYRYIYHENFPFSKWLAITGQTFLKSIAFNDGIWGNLSKILTAIIVLTGYFTLARSSTPSAIKYFLILCPAIHLPVLIIARFRPDAMNGWLFVIPPLFVAAGYAFRIMGIYLRNRFIIFAFILLPVGTNFYFAFLPQKAIESAYHLRASDFNAVSAKSPIGFYVTDPVLTFAEIWAAGSLFGQRNQTVFLPCCGERDTASRIQTWINAHNESLILITDERSGNLETILAAQKRPFTLLRETQTQLKPEWLPSSIFFTREPGYIINKNIRIFKIEALPDLKS